jgi:glutamate-1-semialdehyde 2,1-aminomutase
MGLVPPDPGFLEALRVECDRIGALLVFDEVITGFRIGPAGAQGRFGVRPDISVFGKVIGGGLPLAAVGGPAAVMAHLAPTGPVYQAGTLSGNPLATAAGLAVLGELDEAAYGRLERVATRLAEGLTAEFAAAGVTAHVTRVGTLVGWFLSDRPVRDYEDARAADHAGYARIFHGWLDRGVYTAPSGYEAMFPSLAHTDEDIDAVVAALRDALAAG